MAWYEVTYSCGHTDSVQLYGPVKERERWIEWAEESGLCPQCWEAEKQKKYEEEKQKALEIADELGYPELVGTEKQIAWAVTLRQKTQQVFDDILAKTVGEENDKELVITLWRRVIAKHTDAKWWIDNARNVNSLAIREWLLEEKRLYDEEQLVPEEVKTQAIEEMTIRPETTVANLVAEIRTTDEAVMTKYPAKDDSFREIVKKLGFTWTDGQWQRKVNYRTGSPLDRAAELGVKLLAAGFPVRVFDTELQKKILASDYEPECKRWVAHNTKTGMFLIDWERPDDFFNEAKKLPGARWERGTGMLVPKEAFREVLDFAKQYEFRLSPGAQELVEEARKAYEAAMVAEVKPKEEKQLPKPGRKNLKAVDVTGEIDDELRDKD